MHTGIHPRLVALLALLVVAAPRAASAQPVAELRAQLDALARDRAPGVPEGALTSIAYMLDVAERIDGRFSAQAAGWRERAARYLAAAREGRDPFADERGKITMRGYRSEIATTRQGYAVYLPPDYDPSRTYPLYVALHGGSSNGNLFLGVVLGNNMPWLKYHEHLWDHYEPRWTPPWIVVAPTGYGQILWRWMGEQDVLDVIDDVKRHYAVDPDRVVLGGLSNGGVGAYSIGTRHAYRFSAVQAMAGAPSWFQYAGGKPLPEEATAMRIWSGLHLAENTANTHFRYYHGRTDGGPMKPWFVEEFSEKLRSLGFEPRATWYDTGHDILYLVHRHGKVYDQLVDLRRDRRPTEVRLVSGDYRAARQHWVSLTRLSSYPELGRIHAVVERNRVKVETSNVDAFALDLRDAPIEGETIHVIVDGRDAYAGTRKTLGHRLHLVRTKDGFQPGFPDDPPGELVKRPGLAGPLTDAYFGRMVHVYGTRNPAQTEALRDAAKKGARGWPLWLWDFQQEVVADTEVDEAMMQSAHLVLYGTAGSNAILERIAGKLPIRITDDAVIVGRERFEGRDVGVRFIYPNPEAPHRYLVVQAGVTPQAVAGGHNLPDFVPDYLVYDGQTTRNRARLLTGPNKPRALGFFDARWRLPGSEEHASSEGAGPEDPSPTAQSSLPIPKAPKAPPLPAVFEAPETDPAGRIAREIAQRVRRFPNFRATVPGGTWIVDPKTIWSIRADARCLAALEQAGVPARPALAEPTPVPTPVEIVGAIDGVFFRSLHEDRPLVVACELAQRLPDLARIVAAYRVRGIDVQSATRDKPTVSFHTMGLALDLPRFWTPSGWLSVLRDFAATPDHRTCDAPRPAEPRARALLGIACDLARSGRFSTVLTPNYNEGHRDHFHLDARPNDPRIFVR